MNDYTPGPWRAAAKMVSVDSVPIAETIAGRLIDYHEAEANARLMAAAPDLLAALGVLLDTKRMIPLRVAQAQARAAIAKARGE